ncbi:hypothetical protein ABZ782_28145 [Streptomyces asoensis]|uniref:hypothetical protein n=1 Tax=Streptomyces asoensis TaxID=249586 RepID=UPI0033C8C7D3
MAQYPQIFAGDLLDADLLMSMQPISARKTVSTPRTNATLLADPELVAQVAANAEYALIAYIRTTGGATGDLKAQFTGPAGSSGSWGARTMSTGATVATDSSDAIRTPMNATKSIGAISTTAGQIIQVTGRLVTVSSGTFSFDWAQDVTNATATVIESDSFFLLTRLA